MKPTLVGQWTLVSYEAIAADGSRSLPYGHAVGRLCYDEHGHMAGQVMRPGRPRVSLAEGAAQQVRAAYTGYIAYFGRYEVSPGGDSVTHFVEGALNPEWVGGEQVRKMQLDEHRLVLEAEVLKRGQVVRHVLTWKRLP